MLRVVKSCKLCLPVSNCCWYARKRTQQWDCCERWKKISALQYTHAFKGRVTEGSRLIRMDATRKCGDRYIKRKYGLVNVKQL